MRRRDILAAASALLPFTAWAQSGKINRIGYVQFVSRTPWVESFVDGLRQLGHIEGRNIAFEWRFALGDPDRLRGIAVELAGLNLDVIVCASNPVAEAVRDATSTVPIVALATHDGVGTGLYSSLAQPGGNVTGIESLAPELDVKRVELLKAVMPSLSKLATLHNPDFPGAKQHLQAITDASDKLGVSMVPVQLRNLSGFDAAFASILKLQPEAMMTVADPLIISQRARIISFAVENKLPSAHEFRQFVEIGGLLSYGATFDGMWRRGAYYVDKILRGAKPRDLPVELPTAFELVINRKAAAELGLSIPQSLLISADVLLD